MKWVKVSDYAIRCGEFTISKALVNGVEQYWLFAGNDRIAGYDRAAKAKAEAEKRGGGL